MYTGIIQGVFEITKIDRRKGLMTLEILFSSLLEDLELGASVSINGVCLTVTQVKNNKVQFDAMQETLDKTNLSDLRVNDYVNVERSTKLGAEIGGHVISGHIDGIATINSINRPENNYIIRFKCPKIWMKYILSKGFIGINGASLTIVNSDPNGFFEIHLIPETLKKTTFSFLKIGKTVNIELHNDTKAIVDTVQLYLSKLNLEIK